MSKHYLIIFDLIKASLFGYPLTESFYALSGEDEWMNIYSTCAQQGVLAIGYDAVLKLPKELLPSRAILLKWGVSVVSIENRFHKQKETYEKLSSLLFENDVYGIVMKGLGISRYYPVPEHRECGDIDIYEGCNYHAVNSLLKSKGVKVEEDYYRHSHFTINGIMIENHCCLTDTRGRKDNVDLEKRLVEIANNEIEEYRNKPFDRQGLFFPSATFSALFLSWHQEAHFMFEKIQLRHICDWVLLLKNDAINIDVEDFNHLKHKHTFGKLSDIVTSIAICYFGLPKASIPNSIYSDACAIEDELRDKVLTYILEEPRRERNFSNMFTARLEIVTYAIHGWWKYREVFGVNGASIIMKKSIAFLQEKLKGKS